MTFLANDSTPSSTYIFIGEMLRALQAAEGTQHAIVSTWLTNLMRCLDDLKLPYPKKVFNQTKDEMMHTVISGSPTQKQMGVMATTAKEIRNRIESAHETIINAAHEKLTIVLNSDAVSARLAALPQQLPRFNDVQKSLLAEATRSLETGAYRAATVMGWNMAFDYIRKWIYDKHRAKFNSALTATYSRKNKPAYEKITKYDDFLKADAPSEKIVLDAANSAGIIGGNLYDDLRGYLRKRNSYAHPSGKEPTPNQVNALLEHLADLISGPPFN